MSRDIEELLAALNDIIQDALTIPLGKDRCVIDKDKALAILDEITASMPSYIKDAKRIASEESMILAKAKRDAENTRRASEEQARRLISEQEVISVAKQRASEIVSQAETKSRELRRATNEYVDNTLKRTEEAVSAALNELRQSRVEFRSAAKK